MMRPEEDADMNVTVEKNCCGCVYNAFSKSLQVKSEERRYGVCFQRAIVLFGVTQNAHLLIAFFGRMARRFERSQSVEQAGLRPGQELLLRQTVVKGGFERLRSGG